LILAVLRLKHSVGLVCRELLNVRETFRVEADLRGQTDNIRSGLLVIRLQDFGLLLCGSERCSQLRDLVLKRRWVDLKQHVVGLHRHVRLDRDCDNLPVTFGVTSTTRPVTVTRPEGVR
jgi:hypothetical protein